MAVSALASFTLAQSVWRRCAGGDVAAAAAQYFQENGATISPFILRSELRDEVTQMPVRSLAAELNAIQRQDAGQKIGFLLLMNHQRRMLNIHVENIDLLSCELIEPFFDADFLTLAYRIPVEQGIGHDFFNRWLSQFAPVILSTAWQ